MKLTIEEQLTEIIKTKYKSIMKFSEVIGVKYTTINEHLCKNAQRTT